METYPKENRYFDKHFGRYAVKILPGEYFVTSENTMIVTVVGTGVTVCLMDIANCIGGMNQFLLPDVRTSHINLPQEQLAAHAIELLYSELLRLGAVKSNIVAKAFGAANRLKGSDLNHMASINVQCTLDHLAKLGVTIAASDFTGDWARKVYFFPETGDVKVKKLKTLNNKTIIEREKKLTEKLRLK